MTKAETESIVEIVKKASDIIPWTDSKGNNFDSAKYILPEFQRDFTWTIQQTLDLFDSIVRNVYIGSLVLGQPTFDIAARRVDLRKRSKGLKGKKSPTIELEQSIIKGMNPKNHPILILDGQQRISSLARAMDSDKTNDRVYFVVKKAPSSGGRPMPTKANLVDHLLEFSSEISDDNLSLEIGHVWKVENGTIGPYDMVKLLNPLKISKYYSSLSPTDKATEEAYFLNLIQAVKNMLNESKLVQVFELDTSLQNFTLFFERSNTKGVKLDFIDILSAKVYTKCRLRSLWERLQSKTSLDIKNAKEPIIRLINYFSNRPDPSKNNQISKGKILEDLTGQEIENLFDDISKSWIDVVEWLLVNNIVPSQNRLPYPKMVMPLMAYRFTKKKDLASCPPNETEELRKWITTVAIAERYSMKTNERYLTDIGKFVELANKKMLSKDSAYINEIKHRITTVPDLIEVTATSGALPKAISNLISYENNGYISWLNNKKIPKWNKKDDFQSHHIYPNAFLVKQGMSKNKESIVNRAYIPKLLNIKISDRDPKDYFTELSKTNKHIDVALQKDFIPVWVKNEDKAVNFQKFIDERAKDMLTLIRNNSL